MAHANWTVYVDGNRHTVEIDHGYFSGRRVIKIDGETVLTTKAWGIDFGSVHDVNIGSKTGTVVVKTNGLTFRYDLVIDGISQTTNEKVKEGESTYQPWWGKRPPRWFGGHLSPLEDGVLGMGFGAIGFGSILLVLPSNLFKVPGLVLVAVGVSAYFVRHKATLMAIAIATLLAIIVGVVGYPKAWKLMLLPSVFLYRTVALYRQDLSSNRRE